MLFRSVIVASVSCIFGLGSPDEYKKMVVSITKGTRSDTVARPIPDAPPETAMICAQ